MRSIAIINQKGGVGKTTTAVNVAAAMAAEGNRVCVIDLDPQAHASLHLGLTLSPDEPSIYDVTRRFPRSRTRSTKTYLLSLPTWTWRQQNWNWPTKSDEK